MTQREENAVSARWMDVGRKCCAPNQTKEGNKMMKRIILLLAALLLMLPAAMAEEEALPVIPVEIVAQGEEMLHLSDAVTKAEAALQVLPANCLTRAELVRMSDDSHRWIVSIFDLTNFTDAWCIGVDAVSGEVKSIDTTNMGFFLDMADRWESVKGTEYLWSLEDKLLFDTLYTMQPIYGLPMDGDMTPGEALKRSVEVLGLASTADYEIGYGYLMGAGDGQTNGVWEVYFVQNGDYVYKVNLDAVSGDVYLVEPDESGNG